MTDPIREAFNEWDAAHSCEPQPYWTAWQAAWQQSRRETFREAAELVPSNWYDSRLTGPDGIGQPPWDCRHIESLLNKIRADIRAAAEEEG